MPCRGQGGSFHVFNETLALKHESETSTNNNKELSKIIGN